MKTCQTFLNDLVLTKVDKKLYRVDQPLKFVSSSGRIVEVPKGFTTDLATVPRLLWPFIAPCYEAARPSVIHDYCYTRALFDKKEIADKIFFEALIVEGTPFVRALLMYYGVKIFGRGSYLK